MTSTQYSGGPRGAQNIHCSLCTVSCSGVDAYASHMKGTMNQNLHTRIQKSITSEPMPQSVIYTRGLDSTPRPQQSWTFTTVTIHKPQAWPAQPWCLRLLCCHAEHFSLLKQWQHSCRWKVILLHLSAPSWGGQQEVNGQQGWEIVSNLYVLWLLGNFIPSFGHSLMITLCLQIRDGIRETSLDFPSWGISSYMETVSKLKQKKNLPS